jgi:hypothetical protein
MNNLVVIRSNQELDEMESPEVTGEVDALQDLFSTELAHKIYTQWQINKDERQTSGVTDGLIANLRAKLGEYSPEKLAEIKKHGGSAVKMQLVGGQCYSALGWMTDIFLSSGQDIFGLESGSEPNMPEDIVNGMRQELFQRIQQAAQKGQQMTREQAEQVAREIDERVRGQIEVVSGESLETQTLKIADQFEEGGFYDALEEFLDDFVTFKSAFLEGPIYKYKSKLSWVNGRPQKEQVVVPSDERLSPFDVFPSPGAKRIDDGRLIIRKRFSRSALFLCLGLPGFKSEAVEAVLREFDGYTGWLDTDEEQDRQTLEQRGNDNGEDMMVDALKFYGDVQGTELLEWGVPPEMIEDPLRPYETEAILIGRHVIKCQINDDPLARRPIQKASMANVPGSFWGRALSDRLADLAEICDATARAVVNNVAMCSGPQVGFFGDRMADSQDRTFYPWKMWEFDSDITGGQVPITFFQPESHVQELMGVYEYFEAKAFQVTGIPKYGAIDSRVGAGHGSSAGVAAMLDADAKGVKAALRHIDTGIIKRRVMRQFTDNMMEQPDKNFIGDVRPVAKGAMAVAVKGAQEIRQIEFLQMTANPTDMQILGVEGRAELLRSRAEGLGWSGQKVVPDDATLKERLEAMQQQPNPEAMKMELEKAKLQEMAETRMSKEKIAQLEAQTRLQAAQLSNQERMAELALRENITVAQLQNQLQIKGAEIKSKTEQKAMDVDGKRIIESDKLKARMSGLGPGYFEG